MIRSSVTAGQAVLAGLFYLPVWFLILLTVSCADQGEDPPAPPTGSSVSYASDVRPILQSNCAVSGCHGTGSSSGGLTIGAAEFNEILMSVGPNGAIIVPGNAGESNLYLKTTSNPPFGTQMPLGRSPLSSDQQILIRDWINDGAEDN